MGNPAGLHSAMADEHVIAVNGHKFKFGARDVVQVVVTVIGVVGIYFTVSGKVGKNSDSIDRWGNDNKAIWMKIGSMDEHGTVHSHETDEKQQQTIDYHTKQLDELTRELHELGPKVDKIDQNVLWLMGKQLERR